jgi:hypothetical protein
MDMKDIYNNIGGSSFGPGGGVINPQPGEINTGNASNMFFNQLVELQKKSPLSVSSSNVEDLLKKFKTSLLGGRQATELSAENQTLLTQGENVAKKIQARLNMAQKMQETPGAVAQTRSNQSLLGS